MYGNNGINQTGQRPSSYRHLSDAAVGQLQTQKPAIFHHNFAIAAEGVNRIIAATPQSRELAQALVDYLIREHHLSPQVSSANSAVQNLDQNLDNQWNPDQYDWNAWEKRYYATDARGRYYEKEDLPLLVVNIARELTANKTLEDLKSKCDSVQTFGMGRIERCQGFTDIATLYNQNSVTLTGLMRECVQHRLFSINFIKNELFGSV